MSHHFKLLHKGVKTTNQGVERIDAWKDVFSVLDGISISTLTIAPRAAREPHWHPNAHELGYCISGNGLMTVFGSDGKTETLLVEPGALTYVPPGAVHHIEAHSEEPLKMVIAFSHESPEEIGFSSAMHSMTPTILSATLNAPLDLFKSISSDTKEAFGFALKKQTEGGHKTNRLKFLIEDTKSKIDNQGGHVKVCNQSLFPELQAMSMYSLLLLDKGVREPHWHPNAHELNYLISGKARIRLLSPGKPVEVFDMEPGDISFLPRSYFHSIETIGTEPARFAVFFSNPNPSDIGLSTAFGAYTDEVLAQITGLSEEVVKTIPKQKVTKFIAYPHEV